MRRVLAALFLSAPVLAWPGDPAKSAALFRQGLAQEGAKQYQEALKSFVLSFGEDLGSFKFYREMGNCYYYLGKRQAARDCYAKYLKSMPSDSGIAKLHQALAKEGFPAYEFTPRFPGTDYAVERKLGQPRNIWASYDAVPSRKLAAKLGRPVAYYGDMCKADHVRNPHYNEQAKGARHQPGDIHKALQKSVFEDKEYLAWIQENVVLAHPLSSDDDKVLRMKLESVMNVPVMPLQPLFIVTNGDWSDFKWTYTHLRPESTMLFLMESCRDLKKGKAS